jgi:hemoglobin
MKVTKDITTMEDIQLMVNSFYNKVQKDPLIGDIFNDIIGQNWDKHLTKMYTFWQTLLLDERTYHGNSFDPHAKLPIQKEHFNRWIALFNETVNENFEGEKAEDAKLRAQNIAAVFNYKIEYLRNNPG